MEEFATNDKENYYSGNTSIMVNGKRAYELKGKFLDDLRDNACSGTNGEDVVEHIEYFFKISNDHEGVADKEFSDAEKANNDDEQETAEIFRIETNLFDYETPWKDDGYCNGENFPGAYIIGNTLRYQDLEWYEALEDGKLKDKALKNKAIMEGMIDEDDESHNEGWRRWDGYDNTIHDHEERENKEEHENEEKCELSDNPHQETSVCNIRRFEMIKYSFGEDEEYVAIKEHEYDDLTSTNEDVCRTYQEIFHRMDEGWMVINQPEEETQGKGGGEEVLLVIIPVKLVIMDPSSSVGKTFLGENVIEISSDKGEGHGEWNSPEFKDIANNGGKKEAKAMVFHKMKTEEISDRFVAPLKLCLEHEVKGGNKTVKKELIVDSRGEIYFVKFIINPKEYDVEPGVVFGRSFLRLTKAIDEFGNETVTMYPELDPFLDSSDEEKIGDDWDL
ncbi:hypothetical protein Tco_0746871 [Tanacetum coccineum]